MFSKMMFIFNLLKHTFLKIIGISLRTTYNYNGRAYGSDIFANGKAST